MQPDLASKPEVKALIAQTDSILSEAESYQVVTADDYSASAEVLKRIKGHQRKLEETEMSITRPINEGLKAIRDLFRSPRERAAKAESLVKRAMIAFSDEQERIRREEQRRADEAARKEQERLQQQAAKAAASGKTEKAAGLEERAAAVVAPIVHRETPKVAGINTRAVWKFSIVDEKQIPREFLMVDESKIRKHVANMKGDTSIAGVRVYAETSLASGAA
jgi:hypothetical protein